MPDLLLELFSEEIPARMQAKAAEDLKKLVTERLVDAGLVYEAARAFVTPRRLALAVEGVPALSRGRLGERQQAPASDGAAGLRPVHQGEPRLQSARRARRDLGDRAAELHFARARTRQGLRRRLAGDGRRGHERVSYDA